jgi:hypothetical protein
MATAPSATPAPTSRSGPGCLFFAIAFPVVILLGLVVGTVLNPGDEPGDTVVTLDEGTLDGQDWRVDAVEDVEGDVCAFLYVDDDDVSLNGACTLTPQDVTFGDQTVVFGKAGSDTTEVRVELDTGEVVAIPTVVAECIEGRFYVQIVPGDVDAAGLAP